MIEFFPKAIIMLIILCSTIPLSARQPIPFGFIAPQQTTNQIFESFEEAGTGCPTGWGITPSGNCWRDTSFANDGSKSLFLRAVMDYGSATGIYKQYDLTGFTTIEIDVTYSDAGSFGGETRHCLQIRSVAPTGWDVMCTGGLENSYITNTGKITLDITGYSGLHYVVIYQSGTYWPDAGNFDSLKIY